jgi:hypothetical protein
METRFYHVGTLVFPMILPESKFVLKSITLWVVVVLLRLAIFVTIGVNFPVITLLFTRIFQHYLVIYTELERCASLKSLA